MNIETLSFRYIENKLSLLDQTQLPEKEIWVSVDSLEIMEKCIRELKVRGAPLIGVSAALALAAHIHDFNGATSFLKASQSLRETRPTAVNLMYALDRLNAIVDPGQPLNKEALRQEAFRIYQEDNELCQKMSIEGAKLIDDGDAVLTHCNTGSLATAGDGTALGVIKEAHRLGKNIHVYVDETRPLLQGGRLTSWELEKNKIPYQILCDSMAGALMAQQKVKSVFVGADRIATNGDFANKIGTYSLAILARYHKVPFYLVAPRSTVDTSCPIGDKIPIEMRPSFEVRGAKGAFGQCQWAPSDADVFNPAFDVTPAELVTAFIIDDQKIDYKMGLKLLANLEK